MPTKRAVYNPTFGDERLCACGHSYRRHFDTHDNMAPAGCKYCQCASATFREATGQEISSGLEILFAGGDLLRLAHLEAVAEAARKLCSLRGDVTEGDRADLRAALAKLEEKP